MCAYTNRSTPLVHPRSSTRIDLTQLKCPRDASLRARTFLEFFPSPLLECAHASLRMYDATSRTSESRG
jgi:hypothetical protein